MVEFLNTITLLSLFGATVIIGYLGYLISQKSKIPDVIWLILFGLFIGPVLHLIDPSVFSAKLMNFLSSLALLIILFDAGLHMNIYRVIRDTPRSLIFAISGIIVSMILVGGISIIFLGTDPLTGILFGAILGGTSSPIVLSLLRGSETEGKIKSLLTLESALTDALTIIVSLFLLNLISPLEGVNMTSLVSAILIPFSIGAVVGLVSGILWLFVLDKIKGIPFSHMLTLAIVFILYAFVESFALFPGAGPLASLFFGIVIGNGKNFSVMLKFKKIFKVDPQMMTFHDEITFFIRSFFFVLLGLLVVVNTSAIILGILISVALIIGRLGTAEIGMIRLHIPRIEKHVVRVITPRGLAAAVLAQIIITRIPTIEIFREIVFVVIIVTVIYSSALIMILDRKMGSTMRMGKIKEGKQKIKNLNKEKNVINLKK